MGRLRPHPNTTAPVARSSGAPDRQINVLFEVPRSGDPYQPILFAVSLFAVAAITNLLFRALQRDDSRCSTSRAS
jgi:hypothetical protein